MNASSRQTYIALLRGINVGGHHKVPMAELRQEMEKMGFENVRTLLNSGNVVFGGDPESEETLEKTMAARLEQVFSFAIPVLVRKAEDIKALIDADPFKDIEVTKNIRLYVSFLRELPEVEPALPWISEDGFFKIMAIHDRAVCSVLNISATTTPKGMEALGHFFGKDMTTRNWNTLIRIANKLTTSK